MSQSYSQKGKKIRKTCQLNRRGSLSVEWRKYERDKQSRN